MTRFEIGMILRKQLWAAQGRGQRLPLNRSSPSARRRQRRPPKRLRCLCFEVMLRRGVWLKIISSKAVMILHDLVGDFNTVFELILSQILTLLAPLL